MTFARAAGPGPRTVALRNRRPGSTLRVRAVTSVLVIIGSAALVVACGTATPATPVPSRGSGEPAGPVASMPAGSASGGTDGGGPSASVARWASHAATSMIALAAADAELAKAGADLQAAVGREDLVAMRGAADGLATLVDKLLPDIDDLEAEPATKGIATIYRASFPEISAGAKQLRDAITAGDANGILAGTQRILAGLQAYAPARDRLPDLVEQALTQQRLYTE